MDSKYKTKILWAPFSISILGLAASVFAHLATFTNYDLARQYPSIPLLHVFVFVVIIPAFLVHREVTQRRQSLQSKLNHVPAWMRTLLICLFVYGIFNFAVTAATMSRQPHSATMTPKDLRLFSGHWIFFYALAMTLLYAKIKELSAGDGAGPQ